MKMTDMPILKHCSQYGNTQHSPLITCTPTIDDRISGINMLVAYCNYINDPQLKVLKRMKEEMYKLHCLSENSRKHLLPNNNIPKEYRDILLKIDNYENINHFEWVTKKSVINILLIDESVERKELVKDLLNSKTSRKIEYKLHFLSSKQLIENMLSYQEFDIVILNLEIEFFAPYALASILKGRPIISIAKSLRFDYSLLNVSFKVAHFISYENFSQDELWRLIGNYQQAVAVKSVIPNSGRQLVIN